jgi:hypothetical protein
MSISDLFSTSSPVVGSTEEKPSAGYFLDTINSSRGNVFPIYDLRETRYGNNAIIQGPETDFEYSNLYEQYKIKKGSGIDEYRYPLRPGTIMVRDEIMTCLANKGADRPLVFLVSTILPHTGIYIACNGKIYSFGYGYYDMNVETGIGRGAIYSVDIELMSRSQEMYFESRILWIGVLTIDIIMRLNSVIQRVSEICFEVRNSFVNDIQNEKELIHLGSILINHPELQYNPDIQFLFKKFENEYGWRTNTVEYFARNAYNERRDSDVPTRDRKYKRVKPRVTFLLEIGFLPYIAEERITDINAGYFTCKMVAMLILFNIIPSNFKELTTLGLPQQLVTTLMTSISKNNVEMMNETLLRIDDSFKRQFHHQGGGKMYKNTITIINPRIKNKTKKIIYKNKSRNNKTKNKLRKKRMVSKRNNM